jgi:hypothetical protein
MKKPIRGIRQFLRKSSSVDNINNKSQDDNNNLFKKSQNSEISFEFSDDDLKNSNINTSNFNISSNTNQSSLNQKMINQIPKIPNNSLETIKNKTEKLSIDYFSEDTPLDYLQIVKTEKDDLNINSLISSNQKNLTQQNNNIKSSNQQINNNLGLNKRLLEKIKQVQSLEQNLKEKNKIIEKQKSQIEKLTTELKKNNVKFYI